MRIHGHPRITAKTTELFSQVVANEVVPLVSALDWLEKGAKRLDKKYPEPFAGVGGPVSLVLEKQVPLFLDDLESMKQQVIDHATRENEPRAFEDIFTLYSRVKALLRAQRLLPQLRSAFSITDCSSLTSVIAHELGKKNGRVGAQRDRQRRVYAHRKPRPVHSSSIDDLFGPCSSPSTSYSVSSGLMHIQNARFLTTLPRSSAER